MRVPGWPAGAQGWEGAAGIASVNASAFALRKWDKRTHVGRGFFLIAGHISLNSRRSELRTPVTSRQLGVRSPTCQAGPSAQVEHGSGPESHWRLGREGTAIQTRSRVVVAAVASLWVVLTAGPPPWQLPSPHWLHQSASQRGCPLQCDIRHPRVLWSPEGTVALACSWVGQRAVSEASCRRWGNDQNPSRVSPPQSPGWLTQHCCLCPTQDPRCGLCCTAAGSTGQP